MVYPEQEEDFLHSVFRSWQDGTRSPPERNRATEEATSDPSVAAAQILHRAETVFGYDLRRPGVEEYFVKRRTRGFLEGEPCRRITERHASRLGHVSHRRRVVASA